MRRIIFILCATIITLCTLCTACRREPILHLHRGESPPIDVDFPIVDVKLDVIWDYKFIYDVQYDWHAEWYYGDDIELFGGLGEEVVGYHKPSVFEIRRYYTGDVPYAPHTTVDEFLIDGFSFTRSFQWGFHDLLVWNHIFPSGDDDAVSILFDETTSLDSVIAYTHSTMHTTTAPGRPSAMRAKYQPEELFSAYDRGEQIDQNLTGFVYDEECGIYVKSLHTVLQPLTYIYLTQIILHGNDGRIVGVDGEADLWGMADSTCVNTGHTSSNPVPVYYNVNMKRHVNVRGEDVDIVGGRVMTFGICNMNPYTQTRGPIDDDHDPEHHYIDCTFTFNNGAEKTMAFDVTDQVRQRFKGGVLTVHVNVPDIEIPGKTGGSGFDAVVKDFDEEEHEFEM